MNTQHALILSLILLVAIGVILFFIRLYLKRRKKPISKPHYKDYPEYPDSTPAATHISNVYQRSRSHFPSVTDYSQFQHSSLDNPTPKADDMFDAFKYSSSTFDSPLFGGGDFGGGGAGDSYSSDSGSSDSSSWSDSSSSDSSSDSSSSSWSD
ncbi:hypothetical protein [Runella sp. SP2]|uniref:hypothetical protein n=1 Tax=Runella sp. SP2 TaxID=2268026 RepID=UPI000F075FEC|nr:hypothetical protein [Runella sp. SP2]AYQ31361.1 hypothetical protein DTQ70_03850 [Runella sp. SP2]